MPEIFLYPDRLIVFGRLKLLEFRRADIDAFVYPDSGEKWLIVTAGDRRPAKIFLPQAGPFLDWLRAGASADDMAPSGAALQPPIGPGASPPRPREGETGSLK